MGLQVDTSKLTGYDTHDRYFASRFTQGARKVYSLDLPLVAVAATLPRPNPEQPTEGNRRVDAKHAESFGDYIREKQEWISPALMLRAPDIFEFDIQAEIGGSQYGVVSLPRVGRGELGILDGQHRILGIYIAMETIADELRQARDHVATARRNGEEAAVIKTHEGSVKRLETQLDRLSRDRIAVQIVLEDRERGYKQMFVDIAENAKGITKTLQARFDSRKVVNRVMLHLTQTHPLLVGRIEEHVDRVTDDGQFLAAKHVTELIRAVAVGLGHRISKKQEEALDERAVTAKTVAFFNVLANCFPEITAIQEGKLQPGQLRRTSLLGSATMLRVLAGAYHELFEPRRRPRGEVTPTPMPDAEIEKFFTTLHPYMDAPVTSSLWIETEFVDAGASAPKSRGGDIRRLSEKIVAWARAGQLPIEQAA